METHMEIDKIAGNARLQLTPEEKARFEKELQEIINAFGKLQEVNTDGVEVMAQPIIVQNVSREDVPGKCFSQEDALSNTSLKKDGWFKGPEVI